MLLDLIPVLDVRVMLDRAATQLVILSQEIHPVIPLRQQLQPIPAENVPLFHLQ
jgi:hypothetical protein